MHKSCFCAIRGQDWIWVIPFLFLLIYSICIWPHFTWAGISSFKIGNDITGQCCLHTCVTNVHQKNFSFDGSHYKIDYFNFHSHKSGALSSPSKVALFSKDAKLCQVVIAWKYVGDTP